MVTRNAAAPSRRSNSRVDARDGVWVFWTCHGSDQTSRVLDMSLGGLLVESAKPMPLGSPAEVDFLVQEGQIRVKTIVRHVAPGHAVGLKFTAVTERDRANLATLLTRLRTPSPPAQSTGNSL